jgi:transposase
MAAPVPLRSDFDADGLHTLARCARDPAQTRRLLALSAIYAGGSRSAAAARGGVGLQTVEDWVVAFNMHGLDGSIGGKAPGACPRLDVEQRAALRALMEQGTMPTAHGVVRWRLVDLAQILFEDHGVSVSEQTLSRVLRAMGYANLSARPRHYAQGPDAIPAFKKPFRPPGGDRAGRRQQADRDLVRRRGSGRLEEHDHPPLGQACHATCGTEGPAHRLRLHPSS